MLAILFTIVLGSQTYNVVKDCKDMAHIHYPLDDSTENRTLFVCTDYSDQTKQLVEHELLHACMHNHVHAYKTPQELDKHLHQQVYNEEQLVITLAPCLIDNEQKLFRALVKHEYLSGDG